MNTAAMFSSKTDDWYTPDDLFDRLNNEFGPIVLDVCATPENSKCPVFYTREQDGLVQNWAEAADQIIPGARCWMNPPYGRAIGKWIQKASREAHLGAVTVALLPARVDTAWFHDYILGQHYVRFLRGRLKFGGAKNSAPFPSMVVVFGVMP